LFAGQQPSRCITNNLQIIEQTGVGGAPDNFFAGKTGFYV
jgi:hypothetical protein